MTLEPGQQVRGYLYFLRYDAADGLVVKAPVGSTEGAAGIYADAGAAVKHTFPLPFSLILIP